MIARIQRDHSEQDQEFLDKYKKLGDRWGEVSEKQSAAIDQLKPENATLRSRVVELEIVKPPQPTEKPDVTTRERQSLLKLAVGMAMKKYRFDPKAAKNAATRNIASDLRELGIPLDEDTIRKYLNEAKEVIDVSQTG